jgi:hypothetical protein
MNKVFSSSAALIILLTLLQPADCQKIMKLNDELKKNSTPMEASRKGISSVGKYEFGPYRIISGKAGMTRTTSHQKLFSFTTNSESKSKASFLMSVNNKDTLGVKTFTNSKYSETDLNDFSFLNKSTENYTVEISPANDTTDWKMALVFNQGEEVKNKFSASGILTNGKITISIREVKRWEDGKTALFNMICGYEFYIDNAVVAAVQSIPDTTKKKFVWIDGGLNEQVKSVLAAAAAAIMVHTDSEMGKG